MATYDTCRPFCSEILVYQLLGLRIYRNFQLLMLAIALQLSKYIVFHCLAVAEIRYADHRVHKNINEYLQTQGH